MKQDTCLVCEETVSNPICSSCLEFAVISWLRGRHSELIPQVASMDDLFSSQAKLSVKCILCGGNMSICAHCYYEEIQRLLFRTNPDVAKEFSTFFNFEIAKR
jgi:hypothetical protein